MRNINKHAHPYIIYFLSKALFNNISAGTLKMYGHWFKNSSLDL